MIRAALLDANDVYLRIDEVTRKSDLMDRHVPAVTSCDLPAGQYRWVPDQGNPSGGAFWPVKWLTVQAEIQKSIVRSANKSALRTSSLTARSARREEKQNRGRK